MFFQVEIERNVIKMMNEEELRSIDVLCEKLDKIDSESLRVFLVDMFTNFAGMFANGYRSDSDIAEIDRLSSENELLKLQLKKVEIDREIAEWQDVVRLQGT